MDVPFSLRGGTALATSRGETLEPVAGGALALVLVNPGFGSSTADVYRRGSPRMDNEGQETPAPADGPPGRGRRRGGPGASTAISGEIGQLRPPEPQACG